MRAQNKRVSSLTQPLFLFIYRITYKANILWLHILVAMGKPASPIITANQFNQLQRSLFADMYSCHYLYLFVGGVTPSPYRLPSPLNDLSGSPMTFCLTSRSAGHSKVACTVHLWRLVLWLLYEEITMSGQKHRRLENCCEWMLR